jgi:DNA-binding transcriptional ArsR family regulator
MMRDQFRSMKCAEYLKAVADPDRLKIIQCLQSGPKSVGEICRELNTVIANVSHHLKLLKAAGLVCNRKAGRFVIYSLDSRFVRQTSRSKLNTLDFGCCRLELGEE